MNAGQMRQQLALGTAQFGLDYGITNEAGKLDDETAASLLRECCSLGVTLLDTAGGYGDSEERLGRFLADAPPYPWRVVTKTPAARASRFTGDHLKTFQDAWQLSRRRLGRETIDALLVHHADDLLVPGGDALYGWLRELRASGEVVHIGVSVYDGTQVEKLLAQCADGDRFFDIVQLPASIADQRLLEGGALLRLRELGVEVHARSLYLQGLLLASPEFVEQKFPGKGQWLARLRAFCDRRGMSPLQACLSFFRSCPLMDVAVVGITSVDDMRQLQDAFVTAPLLDWRAWAENDPMWVDPRRWSRA